MVSEVLNSRAMTTFKQPDPFKPAAQPAESWGKWRKTFQIYFGAAAIGMKDENQQRDILLHVLGETGVELYENLNIVEPEQGKVMAILEAISKHYRPYKNTTYIRHTFFTAVQGESTSIDQFVSELAARAKDCDFGDLTDSLIRDRLICGIRDAELRQRLLREGDLPLPKAIDLCRADEISRSQNQEIVCKPDTEVHTVHKVKSIEGSLEKKTNKQQQWNTGRRRCNRCHREHPPRRCPAYGKRCLKCNGLNHFAAACRGGGYSQSKEKVVNTLEEDETDSYEYEEFEIGTLTDKKLILAPKDWLEKIDLGVGKCIFKLDTGAHVNILPTRIYEKLHRRPNLKNNKEEIISYSGHGLQVIGSCDLECTTKKGKTGKYSFIVTNTRFPPILGLRACEELELIKRIDTLTSERPQNPNDIIRRYLDVFQGLGRLPGEHQISIKSDVKPRIFLPRRIPLSLHGKVRQELKNMEASGIIVKVERPTDWVHPIVVVNKPKGGIRICIDPRALNEAINREHLQLPTQEVIFAQLGGAKVFSVLDAASAFHQIALDENSADLCTFATPFGRYRFMRLPFGIKSAPEVFQRAINNTLQDLPGVLCYFDDILVFRRSLEEHNTRLEAVLERARKYNLKLDKEKLQLAKPHVKYIGHVISGEGVKILPDRVAAVSQLRKPMDKKSLQRFLGMITYMARFLPHLATQTEYLRQLLRGNTEWRWHAQADNDFEKLKNLVITAPVLSHFNVSKQITLSADASQYGMGAVMLQDGHPIAFASATFNSTQRGYAQIEKELLAVVFACERFHFYIYGQDIVVETDHKPLVNIVQKQLEKLSPRIQRMVLRLQRYQTHVKYVPGKLQFISDTLSRDPGRDIINTDYLEGEANAVHATISATPARITLMKESTAADTTLMKVKQCIESGWPRSIKEIDSEIKQYWQHQEELHISEELVFRGEKLVIPRRERPDILYKLHESHLGINACKSRARGAVYWPGMSKDIEEYVRNCNTCQVITKTNRAEPLRPHQVPSRPWKKVGIDFMAVNKKEFILAIDYYSKYVELQQLGKTTAEPVINFIKSICARHGVPNIIMTDNGPPFDASLLKEFMKTWDIQHITSSPRYPKSNGMVERAVQTCKNRLQKTIQDGQDPYIALLNYRVTPHNGLDSPGELLMGRKLRSLLPTTEKLLKPKFETAQVRDTLKQVQAKQKFYADKRAGRPLKPLRVGENIVYAHTPTEWRRGTILRKAETPRSYEIKTTDGTILRRNRVHVKPVNVMNKRANVGNEAQHGNTNITTNPTEIQIPGQCKNIHADEDRMIHDEDKQGMPAATTEEETRTPQTEDKQETAEKMMTPIAETKQDRAELSPSQKSRCGRPIRTPQRYKE